MNHKQLAEDALHVAKNAQNAGVVTEHLGRAQVHAALAQLEVLERIETALVKGHPVTLTQNLNRGPSIEELREELNR